MGGIGNARSLAKIFSLLGEGKLLKNQSVLEKIRSPKIVGEEELVFRMTWSWGWGFKHTKNPEVTRAAARKGGGETLS